MKRLLIATRNYTKYLLFSPTFTDAGFHVCTLLDTQADAESPDESGETPEENALAKARRYHSPQYPWVFADDAGLEIDALDGQPGIRARRWDGRFADDVDDETWLDYLMERMAGVPLAQRTARFFAAWVLISPNRAEHIRHVTVPFTIATDRIRPISPGSPLSAVIADPERDVETRSREIFDEFQEWGILAQLL